MRRWRESDLGRSEEMNPALWVLVPICAETNERLLRMFNNQPYLVTMHDVRVTLTRLPRRRTPRWGGVGIDLFANAVPANRTCEDAQIPLKYCPFVADVPVDRASLEAHADGIFAAWDEYVSSVLLEYKQFYNDCEPLGAAHFELTRARSFETNRYTILLQRRPQLNTGFSIEAAMIDTRAGQHDSWEVTGASRTTSYAHESCHSRLPKPVRELCFCR